jgi:LmbE family N-acetylglucosaminyl deacetylase
LSTAASRLYPVSATAQPSRTSHAGIIDVVATLVCFHAHPDDEAIITAGVMASAAAQGHRVVLVVATAGEEGEVADGFLEPGVPLADRRVIETSASAELLGVSRVEFLGYRDSGMVEVQSSAPDCFWRADVEEAARRVAAILSEESADVVTVYDDHGTYGHPDHIQVHRVGVRAAELAGTERVYEATVNRDQLRRLAGAHPTLADAPDVDEMELGVSEDLLTTAVDVSAWLAVKRAAMRAHASQISEQSFFLALSDEAFAAAFGVEWFTRRGARVPAGVLETTLFAGLAG